MREGLEVKVCKNCCRINPDDAETCTQCAGDDFDTILMTLEYDSIIPYQENE